MESSRDISQAAVPKDTSNVIPDLFAQDLRKLSHDLSNALEVVVQTSYLLTMSELQEPASEWLRMLEGGVSKALEINNGLRTYLREHSPK